MPSPVRASCRGPAEAAERVIQERLNMNSTFETAFLDEFGPAADHWEPEPMPAKAPLAIPARFQRFVALDIETGPLPESELRASLPAFDEGEVKCGNLKDPEKIAAKIAEAKAAHETNYFERAALRADTGRVVAIGLGYDIDAPFIVGVAEDSLPNEASLLEWFWETFIGYTDEGRQFVGFNLLGFDVPFLLRRSWLHGLDVPRAVFAAGGRYLNDRCFIDLMQVWQAGARQDSISLDRLSKFLGVGEKNGNGADFHKLWETDRPKAREYLANDLAMTMRCATRLLNFF